MRRYALNRSLPQGLEGLEELALDLRWTWSHFSDRLWELLDPETWEWTGNPYFLLQSVSQTRLEEAADDPGFKERLQGWLDQRRQYMEDPGWFGREHGGTDLKGVAFFSMEFGLGEALPIYSGGLGILAGDYLKSASDLGIPIVGIGLLYQEGYFRQILTQDGWQQEAFPYNDPTNLPVTPVQNHDSGWLRIRLTLPGRSLFLRVWQAQIGKVKLYLLDSNDPLNSPRDRGMTAHLYPAGREQRLMQEIILGVGGWLVLEELGQRIDVCHLNEGHAAFAILARAVSFMRQSGQSFQVALRATRAGNVFTTHTPVEAAFDRFETSLIRPYAQELAAMAGMRLEDVLGLGRRDPDDPQEPFNMAFLAMRGCISVNGVSRLHGIVSRGIFQPLYPDWPSGEVPIGFVTNGVHVASWDSAEADALWTYACGKDRWVGSLEFCQSIDQVDDAQLWSFRTAQRDRLVRYVRRRLVRQLREHGAAPERIERAQHVLDPNLLTIGFARRFTAYKRPTLVLQDPDRLARVLTNPTHPVQLVVAGKAHPSDEEGKHMVQALAQYASCPDLIDRVVFLEDYDMALAEQLVAGVDVWINTPRRPLEACGTSGMKVLVNGGLNLSELDGWWAEAYSPEVGWALGDGTTHGEPGWDASEADQLYRLLEQEIVPTFYTRDENHLPTRWLHMVRTSMSRLTPAFSGNRMVREYVERIYLPVGQAYRRREADKASVAAQLELWREHLQRHWRTVRFGDVHVNEVGEAWHVEAQVYFGELDPEFARVELYADPQADQEPTRITMDRKSPIPGAVNGFVFMADAPATRPAHHYTPRVVPYHPEARVPLEDQHILWNR